MKYLHVLKMLVIKRFGAWTT